MNDMSGRLLQKFKTRRRDDGARGRAAAGERGAVVERCESTSVGSVPDSDPQRVPLDQRHF